VQRQRTSFRYRRSQLLGGMPDIQQRRTKSPARQRVAVSPHRAETPGVNGSMVVSPLINDLVPDDRGVNRGRILKQIQQEAAVGFLFMLAIDVLNYILLAISFSASLWIDLILICAHGTTISGKILGYQILAMDSLLPYRSPIGYLFYILARAVLGLVPWAFIYPGCCCGSALQSCVDRQFGVLWVDKAEFAAMRHGRFKDFFSFYEKAEEESQGCAAISYCVLCVVLPLLAVAAFIAAVNLPLLAVKWYDFPPAYLQSYPSDPW
jgi:hypothetical protein